ncbi:MAG: TonB-dependent receptor [Bdellovibrionales bacterium]|nr:TonB-dependent receptor [Bdellovibrionales bacterium]
MLTAVVFVAPFPANADERDALGEECFEALHDDRQVDETTWATCLEKFRALRKPTIVITPSRRAQDSKLVPAAVAVVTRAELAKRPSESLADAMSKIPGVEITDAGQAGLKRVRVRGEESRRVAILIDGQPFSDEREVGTPLLLAPEMVDHIEVVRGTGSVLHGSRAIGGVVNFITKKGGYHPVQGTVSSQLDSATEGYRQFGSVYGGADGWGYRAAGSFAESDNRDTPDGEVEDTAYEDKSVLLFLSKKFGPSTIAASFDNYQSSSDVFVEPEVRTTPPFLDFSIDAPQRDRRKGSISYEWEPEASDLKRFSADIYHQESEREFNTFSTLAIETPAGVTRNQSDVFNDSELLTTGGSAQGEVELGANLLIVGIDGKGDRLDQARRRELNTNGLQVPSEIVFDEAEQSSLELFAQDEYSFAGDWALTFGARGYFVRSELEETTRAGLAPASNDDRHVVSSAALRYSGFENMTIWGGWSQGFVHPTLINLATGAFAGPDFVSPNPDLDPETSNSVELGWRLETALLSSDVSFFYTAGEDFIEDTLCSEDSPSCLDPAVGRRDRVYDNIDEVRSFGGEFSATFQPDDFISPYASFSWIRRKFETEQLSSYDTGIPTFSGRIGVYGEQRLAGNVLGWADMYLRTASEADERDREGRLEKNPGWGTLNLSVGADLGLQDRIRIAFDFLNVGDKLYTPASENIPARGLSAIAKITAEF